MENKMNECYILYGIWTDSFEYSEQPGIFLKSQDNKIIDCFDSNKYNYFNVEGNLDKIIGENVRDFIWNSIATHKILNLDLSDIENEYLTFHPTDNDFFMQRKKETFNAEEIIEHDKKVASILQSKENKNTLGKSDMLNKIADIKNARTGGK